MLELPCKKPELYQYSPHKSRMLLLDSLDQYSIEESWIETSVEITANVEFFDSDKKGVPVWISFEYMAQSIALLAGLVHRQNGIEPKIGFIMAFRNFIAEKEIFQQNQKVSIRVDEVFRDKNLAVFDGKSYVQGELYSKTTLNVIEHSQELMDRWKL